MTGAELVPFRESAQLVVSTIQMLAAGYRENRVVARSELDMLRLRLEHAEASAKSRAIGDLARTNLGEIVATYRQIQVSKPDEYQLGLMLDQLELLSRRLKGVLDAFAS